MITISLYSLGSDLLHPYRLLFHFWKLKDLHLDYNKRSFALCVFVIVSLTKKSCLLQNAMIPGVFLAASSPQITQLYPELVIKSTSLPLCPWGNSWIPNVIANTQPHFQHQRFPLSVFSETLQSCFLEVGISDICVYTYIFIYIYEIKGNFQNIKIFRGFSIQKMNEEESFVEFWYI